MYFSLNKLLSINEVEFVFCVLNDLNSCFKYFRVLLYCDSISFFIIESHAVFIFGTMPLFILFTNDINNSTNFGPFMFLPFTRFGFES